MKILILVLSVGVVLAFIDIILLRRLYKKLWQHILDDYSDEKHFCNYCKKGFVHNKYQRSKTVCDYCGRPLTFHCNKPNYIPNETTETPFAEFDNKKDGE